MNIRHITSNKNRKEIIKSLKKIYTMLLYSMFEIFFFLLVLFFKNLDIIDVLALGV